MRIATWNVNSLKARLDRALAWLDRVAPDVLLLQETKLADGDAPADAFRARGYELSHHGAGGRNGVAIASRLGLADVVVAFGEPARVTARASDQDPLSEARMIAATSGGVRFVCVYAPNGRTVGSPTFTAKLAWYERLATWLAETCSPGDALVVGGDMNVAPDDRDVWDEQACHGGTHVTREERAAFARLLDWGLVDTYRRHCDKPGRYTWWDYRAGHFFKNFGMRIDHLLATASIASRSVAADIDREERKGKPTPSDHAPLVVDLDAPGKPFDGGWAGAEKRIAERLAKRR